MELNRGKVHSIIQSLYYATGANSFFEMPVIKIADADDTLFIKIREVIGEHHWTPQQAFKEAGLAGHAASVIVWTLPVTEKARSDNRKMSLLPAREWARTRSFGELANEQMRCQLVKILSEAGHKAVAPHLLQKQKGYKAAALGYTSYWSERHAAFAAGLGTFGISAGLITENGVAVRLGSVVTDLKFDEYDLREYKEQPYAWCSRCGSCIRRCPVKAIDIDPAGRNKEACFNHIFKTVAENRLEKYGWMELELGCGLCQSGVPCEFKRPGV